MGKPRRRRRRWRERENEGEYRREAGSRAYDIKHYNYYLNSSRMAPGVAAPSSSSFPPFSSYLPLSLALFLSIATLSFLSRLPSPTPPCRRMAAQPRAFCSRIPVAPRRPILLLFRSRFAPAPPARRRDSLGLVPVELRDRDEKERSQP